MNKKEHYIFVEMLFFHALLWIYLAACLGFFAGKIGFGNMPIWIWGILAAIGWGAACLSGQGISAKLLNRKSFVNRPFYRSVWGWETIITLVLTLIVSWLIVEVDMVKFFTKFPNAANIVSALFDPNFAILKPMLSALVETIYLALLATILAIPFSFVFSFLAARNLMFGSIFGQMIYGIMRTVTTIFRSIESIVWALIFSVWVGIGPFAGMLALMIHSIAALTKLYSEQIENIDPGPVEAIRATGANTLQVWLYGVVPPIFSPFLAFTIYRWDINIRMATIVGFVGGGGIGLALKQQQQMLQWRNVGLIMWLIAIIVWLMDMISGKLRQKLMD